jgi:hypothetical protein
MYISPGRENKNKEGIDRKAGGLEGRMNLS